MITVCKPGQKYSARSLCIYNNSTSIGIRLLKKEPVKTLLPSHKATLASFDFTTLYYWCTIITELKLVMQALILYIMQTKLTNQFHCELERYYNDHGVIHLQNNIHKLYVLIYKTYCMCMFYGLLTLDEIARMYKF